MSEMEGSLSSGSSGPRPKTSSRISSMSFLALAHGHGEGFIEMSRSTTAPTSARTLSLVEVAELLRSAS